MHEKSLLDLKHNRYSHFGQEIKRLPVRKGRSSVRVLSTPRAKAMVDSFLMLFNRNYREKGKKYVRIILLIYFIVKQLIAEGQNRLLVSVYNFCNSNDGLIDDEL